MLKKRISDIEAVINQHFGTIKKAIFQDKSDKILRQLKKDEAEQKKLFGNKN
jgi:hypothetical protein